MATISTVAMLNAKCMSMIKSPRPAAAAPPAMKPAVSLLSLQNLPRGLSLPKNLELPVPSASPLTATAIAGAFFSALSASDAAFAAQQVADIAEGDNRGLALLLPIVPAVLWVLYNILQPALNQLNRMRSEKGFVVGLGLGGGLAAAGFVATPSAEALQHIADIAEGSGDSRALALLIPIIPAILWVLYNILQPALNQINRMRSG